MTSDKTAENVLAALDDLQQQQARLLSEMRQGQVGINEKPIEPVSVPSMTKDYSTLLTEDDIESLIKEIEQDLGIDLNVSSKTELEPIPLNRINDKFTQQFSVQKESIALDALFPPVSKQKKPTEAIKTSTPQTEYEPALQSALPSFPDISVFDPPKKANKPKNKIRKIISAALFYGLLLCLIGGAFMISQGEKKPILDYSFMNVLTWSMQSEIPQGSMIAVKKVDPNTIQIGDDITYMKDAETSVTHRVIGITENYENSGQRGFETQGIENDSPDFEIVPAINVVGKVQFHIPNLGNWLEWLREHLIVTILFTVGLILLIFLLKGAFKKSPEKSPPQKRKQSTKIKRLLSTH